MHRTDDVIFIHIFAGHWRDTKMKQALYKHLAELLGDKPGLRSEDVQAIISSNGRDDWSFGKGLASYVKEESGAAAPDAARKA